MYLPNPQPFGGIEDGNINENERFKPTNGREAGAGKMAWLDNPVYPEYNPKHSIKFYIEGGEKEGAPDNFPPAKEVNRLFQERLLEKGHQHNVLNPHMAEGEHYERFWQANKESALVALQPSAELLAARERMQEFRVGMPHKTSDLAASREDVKKDDSLTSPLQTTPKPPWEQ